MRLSVDSNNLTRSGYITPAVDFSNIQEVLVITSTKEDLTQNSSDSSKGNSTMKRKIITCIIHNSSFPSAVYNFWQAYLFRNTPEPVDCCYGIYRIYAGT